MRIDDFVCLGRTVPETSTKYGVKVCMAGYSEELRSLIRVYPLEIANPVHARSRCVLELERNPNDSRIESWKLHDRRIMSVGPQVPTPSVLRFLRGWLSGSIKELNERRVSLGVIEVSGECQGVFKRREEVVSPDQGTLFDMADSHGSFGAKLDIAPYLSFSDPEEFRHTLQVREWGVYEWVRKNRPEASSVWDNLSLRDGRPTILVVGNMNNYRNTWLVIKVFKAERESPLLFDDANGIAASMVSH